MLSIVRVLFLLSLASYLTTGVDPVVTIVLAITTAGMSIVQAVDGLSEDLVNVAEELSESHQQPAAEVAELESKLVKTQKALRQLRAERFQEQRSAG